MTAARTSVVPTVEHDLGPDGLLVIRPRAEDVRIRAVEGTIVRISGSDGRPVEGLEVVRGPRSLEVRSAGPTDDLFVDVPRATNVLVETSSSDIEVDGLVGDQRYRTASGDISLRDVGGTIAVEAMSGDVDVVVAGTARLDVRTVSGDVELRADSIAQLRVATTSGDLAIAGRFEGDGPFSIETVSGDATLAPAGDVGVEVQTITGEVRSELAARLEEAPGRRTLVVGTGGPRIAFRSTSGDLRLVALTRRHVLSGPDSGGPLADPADGAVDDPDADGLAVLRALERGDIDVAEARRRLEALDRGEPFDPTDPTPAIAGASEEATDA